MILLDTNILSALMNNAPDPHVVNWLNHQNAAEIWTTAISIFEVRFGLSRMKAGRRQQALSAAFEQLVNQDLAGRVAIVDRAAAEAAGVLAAKREAAGQPVDVRDTLIAGIALARKYAIATRNTRHFSGLEVLVINPWLD